MYKFMSNGITVLNDEQGTIWKLAWPILRYSTTLAFVLDWVKAD